MSDPVPNATKKPFFVMCGDSNCKHCWPAAYLPMEASKFARATMNLRCPMCGHAKPVIPRQANGALLESDVGETARSIPS